MSKHNTQGWNGKVSGLHGTSAAVVQAVQPSVQCTSLSRTGIVGSTRLEQRAGTRSCKHTNGWTLHAFWIERLQVWRSLT